MRALRYDAVGGPIRLVETAPPACPGDGALINVRATGVCRSDWHAWRGHETVPLPQVAPRQNAGGFGPGAGGGPQVPQFGPPQGMPMPVGPGQGGPGQGAPGQGSTAYGAQGQGMHAAPPAPGSNGHGPHPA